MQITDDIGNTVDTTGDTSIVETLTGRIAECSTIRTFVCEMKTAI